jgi:hypothetical protein
MAHPSPFLRSPATSVSEKEQLIQLDRKLGEPFSSPATREFSENIAKNGNRALAATCSDQDSADCFNRTPRFDPDQDGDSGSTLFLETL